MNLHAIVGPLVASVNPTQTVTIRRSTGYVTNPDFSRTPTYETFTAPAQIQALTFGDLRQLDGLNLSGLKRAIYFYGSSNSTVRVTTEGGDLITFPDGSIWLVAQVLEVFGHGVDGSSGWTKCAVVLQNGS